MPTTEQANIDQLRRMLKKHLLCMIDSLKQSDEYMLYALDSCVTTLDFAIFLRDLSINGVFYCLSRVHDDVYDELQVQID